MIINCYTTFADGYECHMKMFLFYYLYFCDNIYVIYDNRDKNKCDFLESFNNNKIKYKIYNLRGNQERFLESERKMARDKDYFIENKNADWNIIVDCDEFILSPIRNQSIKDFLSQHECDYFFCNGYNVTIDNENNNEYFDRLPNLKDLLYLKSTAYNKPIISKKGINLN